MSDFFAKPEVEGAERAKPPLCRAYGPRGERCGLYRDHADDVTHKDAKTGARWISEDEYADA